MIHPYSFQFYYWSLLFLSGFISSSSIASRFRVHRNGPSLQIKKREVFVGLKIERGAYEYAEELHLEQQSERTLRRIIRRRKHYEIDSVVATTLKTTTLPSSTLSRTTVETVVERLFFSRVVELTREVRESDSSYMPIIYLNKRLIEIESIPIIIWHRPTLRFSGCLREARVYSVFFKGV